MSSPCCPQFSASSRPHSFYFCFRIAQMKRIKTQHPEISAKQLHSQIENRWNLIDKEYKMQKEENFKNLMTEYTQGRRWSYVKKKTATSDSASTSEQSKFSGSA